MTRQEALEIADLCIDVKPSIEDAFFFFNSIVNRKSVQEIIAMSDEESAEYMKYNATACKAGERLLDLTPDDRTEAITTASRIRRQRRISPGCRASWKPD